MRLKLAGGGSEEILLAKNSKWGEESEIFFLGEGEA